MVSKIAQRVALKFVRADKEDIFMKHEDLGIGKSPKDKPKKDEAVFMKLDELFSGLEDDPEIKKALENLKKTVKAASVSPDQFSSALRQIAARIEASRNPDKRLVARDLRRVIANLARVAWSPFKKSDTSKIVQELIDSEDTKNWTKYLDELIKYFKSLSKLPDDKKIADWLSEENSTEGKNMKDSVKLRQWNAARDAVERDAVEAKALFEKGLNLMKQAAKSGKPEDLKSLKSALESVRQDSGDAYEHHLETCAFKSDLMHTLGSIDDKFHFDKVQGHHYEDVMAYWIEEIDAASGTNPE